MGRRDNDNLAQKRSENENMLIVDDNSLVESFGVLDAGDLFRSEGEYFVKPSRRTE